MSSDLWNEEINILQVGPVYTLRAFYSCQHELEFLGLEYSMLAICAFSFKSMYSIVLQIVGSTLY